MLHLAHKISGAAVRGTDGDIGTLEDFYFEEDRWTVRYLLVDTGKWFSGKRVLISPMSVSGENRVLPASAPYVAQSLPATRFPGRSIP